MSDELDIELTVNGESVHATVAPSELLLDFLRERLDLRGAKRSCDVQVCGTCTVLVDGGPVSACTYLAVEARRPRGADRRGARADGRVRRVRVRVHAPRGAPVRLLHARPAADAEEPARRGRAAHRGGHPSTASTARSAAAPATARSSRRRASSRGSTRVSVEQRVAAVEVGVSRPRKDAAEKLRGQAQYVGDMEMAGMLHGKVAAQPASRTRGSAASTSSAALAMEGVAAVLTGRRPRRHRALLRPRDQGPPDRRDRPRALRGRAGRRGRRGRRGDRGGGGAGDRGRLRAAAGARHGRAGARPRGRAAARAPAEDRPLPRPRRARRAAGQRLLPPPDRVRRRGRGARAARRSSSRAPTPSPRSTSTRWRRTRRSRTTTATASRCGPTASTRSSCRPRSPTSSACRSGRCGSSSPTSAAASARSPTRRWSR